MKKNMKNDIFPSENNMDNVRETRVSNRIKFTCFIALTIVFSAIAFGVGTRVGAANGEPGSMSDPLITESYLDLKLKEAGSGEYFFTNVESGKDFLLSAGGRLVLYSGEASAKGSLIDITDGVLLKSGGTIVKYHEYLVPVDDSGIKMNSSGFLFSSKSR